jgi:hypothetical protein
MAAHAHAQCLTARLIAGDTVQPDEKYGAAIGLSQGALAIGAKGARSGTQTPGAAYIYRASGSAWNSETRLVPDPIRSGMQFGAAIAIDGDVCLVTAPMDNAGVVAAGAAYVFRRTNGSWAQEARLTAPDPMASDQLGLTCAISGNMAVVGVPFKSDVAIQVGCAYIFERVNGTWSAGTRIDPSDGLDAAFFGTGVACAPGMVIVGAGNKFTGDGGSQGAVYIYRKVGSNWARDPRLTPADAAPGDGFGSFVSLSGPALLIGAYAADGTAGADQGAAYIFRSSGSAWIQETKLFAADAGAGELFGSTGSISGDRAVIGAYKAAIAPGANQGAAYIFTRSGSNWTETCKLQASDPAPADAFSVGAAIDGTTVALGAQFVDGMQSNSGAAYVFSATACTCYANCDGSTVAPNLNINDFVCFMNAYAVSDPWANCDHSTAAPVLNINDFQCFLNQFALGCS